MQKKKHKMSKHHRICRSHSEHIKGNVVLVRDDHHRHYHGLFNNMYPHQIAEELNRRWIDPRLCFITIQRSDYEAVRQFIDNLRGINLQEQGRRHLRIVQKDRYAGRRLQADT